MIGLLVGKPEREWKASLVGQPSLFVGLSIGVSMVGVGRLFPSRSVGVSMFVPSPCCARPLPRGLFVSRQKRVI